MGSRSNLDALIEVNSWKKAAEEPNSVNKKGKLFSKKKQNKKAQLEQTFYENNRINLNHFKFLSVKGTLYIQER